MTHKGHLVTLAVLLLGVASVLAQPAANPWEDLNLKSKQLDRGMLCYEAVFEPNLPFFETAYSELLAAWDKTKNTDLKRDVILEDIYHILGIQTPDTKMQNEIWAFCQGFLSSVEDFRFFLVRQPTLKDHLRSGGTLPNFSYDRDTDEVIYDFNVSSFDKDSPIKQFEMVCPIESERTLEKDIQGIFNMLDEVMCEGMVDAAIHEVVEMSLLKEARPTDPYWRWFSDGFANAITYGLLKKHFGEEAAEDSVADCDVTEYEAIKTDINLQYWLTGRSCLLLQDAPLEAAKQVNLARYAYATLEARRLIDAHGMDSVRAIMDDIKAKPSRTGQDLLAAIQRVTGEDMQDRLSRYQAFETRQDGIRKYAAAFNKASKEKDLKVMLLNLFRIHDLRLPSQAHQSLSDYMYAGKLLFKMGNEKDADDVMKNCMELFSHPRYSNGKLMSSEAFIVYAIECQKPLKARKVAEELLQVAPDNVSGLTIQMFIHLDEKQLDEAKRAANKIISLSDNKKSRNHELATAVLAINPGNPKNDNESQ